MKRLLFTHLLLKKSPEPEEPDWNALVFFGLPVARDHEHHGKYDYNTVKRNIKAAANYLLNKGNDPDMLRYLDSFKSLLLSLKTHYPSRFKELEKYCELNLTRSFHLNEILGRHIKLRNICLSSISLYFQNNKPMN